jgi:hypothetical protein
MEAEQSDSQSRKERDRAEGPKSRATITNYGRALGDVREDAHIRRAHAGLAYQSPDATK